MSSFAKQMKQKEHSLPSARDFVNLCSNGLTLSEAYHTLGYSPDVCRECIYRSGSGSTKPGMYWMSMSHGSRLVTFHWFLNHCGHRLDPERLEIAKQALGILELQASDV